MGGQFFKAMGKENWSDGILAKLIFIKALCRALKMNSVCRKRIKKKKLWKKVQVGLTTLQAWDCLLNT